ncbi:MAG: NTP transferase domain-containing protein [Anaerolineae bacterium]|nr:NTP transferase domain-containing protein [Anaerolineae bacterium]
MIQQAVILAAGRGTRLGDLTKDRPKSMLPVLGKPIVVRVMDRMREAGIRRFVVVVGLDEGGVASYLSSSWYPDTEIKFVLQVVPTGTVDALLLAAPHIDGSFLLTSVDNLTSLEHIQSLLARFDQFPDQIAALSLLETTPDSIKTSPEVIIDGDWVTAIEEKPVTPRGTWSSFMLYAFAPRLLEFLPQVKISPRSERDIVSAIQAGIKDGARVSYVIADWRLHLARAFDLLAINQRFLSEQRDTHILSEIPDSVRIVPPVRIDPNVTVGQDARIGPNVYLESGAAIGQGAVLANSVILTGSFVPAGDVCQGQILYRKTRISEKTSP